MPAILPHNASEQVKALYQYPVLPTESEADFDDLTRLAAQICQTPVALIHLMQQGRQWVKSGTGLPFVEVSQDLPFYQATIQQRGVLVVENTSTDACLWAQMQAIASSPLYFYAGVPLLTQDGEILGILSVLDLQPRSLSSGQKESLETIGRQVVAQLELRRCSGALVQAVQEHRQLEETLQEERQLLATVLDTTDDLVRNFVSTVLDTTHALVAVLDPQGRVVRTNQVCTDTIGYSFGEAKDQYFWDLFVSPEKTESFKLTFQNADGKQLFQDDEFPCLTKDGHLRVIVWSSTALLNADGSIKHFVFTGVDMTERRQVEAERDRFFTLSLDMLAIASFDNYFTYISPAWERTLGFEQEELLSQAFTEFVHPDDLEATLTEARKLSLGINTISFENRYRCKDGSYRWLSWKATALLDEKLIYAVARDITENKQAEVNMQRTQAFLNSIVENIPHMIFVKDAQDLRFVSLNRAGERLLGIPREKLIGKTNFDVFAKDEADDFTYSDLSALQNGQALDIPESTIHTKQRGQRVLHTKKIPIFNAEGQAQYLLGIAEDITERKRAEAALQESERQYRSVVESVKEVIFQLNIAGLWTFLNPAWTEITGFSLGYSIGTPISDYLHPADYQWHEQQFQALLSGAQPYCRHEIRCITQDGDWCWLEIYAIRMLNASGVAIGISGTLNDITERKQAEAAWRDSETKFQKMALNIPGMIYQFLLRKDGSTKFPFVSPGCYELYEVEPSALETNAAVAINMLHPADRQEFTDAVAVSASTLQPWQWQGRIVTPSGKLKWLQGAARPEVLTNGDILWHGLLMDITGRKRAEEELQKSNQQVSKILESITDAFFALDPNWNFTYLNSRAEQILFQNREEVIGRCIWDVLPEAAASTFYQEYHRAVSQQVTVHFEEFYSPLGIWFEVQAYPYEDGLAVYFRDVTARKQAEAELMERSHLATLSAEISSSLSRGGGLADILEQAVEAIAHHLDAAFVRIWTFNADSNLLELQAIAGQHSHTEEFSHLIPPGISIVGFIAQNQATYVSNDVSNDFCIGATQWVQREAMVAFAGYPLIVEERLMGVMVLFSRHSLSEATQGFLAWAANNIAIAIDRAWAREELLSRREALLLGLANQIRNSLDLDKILETTVTEIRALLQIDRCHFLWCWPHPEQPNLAITHEARHPDLPSLLGDFPSEYVAPLVQQILNLEVVRINDVAEEPESESDRIALLTQLGITAQLLLPIVTRSGQHGAIVCSHSSGPHFWSDSEIELLQAVTDQLAIGMDQAELYAQSRATALAAQAQAHQLTEALQHLKQTQTQLIQTEKMSSLGQLVAGVAHEINNPVNFISGNLVYAEDYIQDLLDLLKLYEENYPDPVEAIQNHLKAVDFEFLQDDLVKLLSSMKMGAERIRQIVLSLRNFSRLDEADMKPVNIHEGIDNTLLILQNRLKPNNNNMGIQVIKDYSDLPLVECYAGQLNQVFMNILGNAIDAIEEQTKPGVITICTELIAPEGTALTDPIDASSAQVAIRIRDNGPGISEDVRDRLFDPFFTTKSVGKGTGLGLSISYQIVVDKHRGTLQCSSEVGQGSEFLIQIPIAPPFALKASEIDITDPF